MCKIPVKFLRYLLPLLLFSLVFQLSTYAQDKALVDSLTKVLEESPKDTNRIDILVNLWRAVIYNNPQQAKVYAEEILHVSQELNFIRGIAAGHQRLGVSYSYLSQSEKSREEYQKALAVYKSKEGWNEKLQAIILFNLGLEFKYSGDYDSTLVYLSRANEVFERVGTPTQRGAVFDGKSGVYIEQGKYQLGIENALKAAEAFEEAQDSMRLPDALFKIGQASVEIQNYKDALKYYFQSYRMYQKNYDTKFETDVLGKIASVYSTMEERDSSLYYYKKGVEKARNQDVPDLLCDLLIGLSGEYLELKSYSQAEPLLLESLDLAEGLNNPIYLIPALNNLGMFHYHQKSSLAKTESYLLRALDMAREHGYLDDEIMLTADLAILYKNRGKPSKAIEYFFAHQALKDSMVNEATQSKIAELQTLYETEKKDREIEQQKSEIKILQQDAEINNLNRRLLLGGISLSLLLMLAIFLGYRQKIKRDQAIHEKEKAAFEQEILFNKKELAAHTLHLVQKSDLLEELKAQLESTRKESGESKQNLTQMIQLIKSDKHVEQDWQNFKSYFDKVHESFDEKLRQLSEGLSQNEYRLAALMKMDLSTKEIATILNITSDSVHKGRYRLKKRLGMGADENLRDFILSL